VERNDEADDKDEEDEGVGVEGVSLLTDDGIALLEEAPAVPDGLISRAMYPNKPFVEPQRSEGNPGHGSLHLLVDC
jgi:hypothetical protein